MPRILSRHSSAKAFVVVLFLLLSVSLTGAQRSVWRFLRTPFSPINIAEPINIASAASPARVAGSGSTFIVNSTGDGSDTDLSDGLCNDGTGACTLRAAIMQANFFPASPDVINFNLPANSTITLNTGLEFIQDDLDINGPGANTLTIQRSTAGGTPRFRIFTVVSNTVNISGLTITNGHVFDGVNATGGGGISTSTDATLNLNGVVVRGNRTGNGEPGGGGDGGGIFNFGTMLITNSTISGNTTGTGGSAPGTRGGYGGGINNAGTLTLINTTVSGNATGNGASSTQGGYGGGIYNATQLQLTLINCTVTNNQTGAGGFGGGIRNDAVSADLKDSIVANNHTDVDGATGPDLHGNFHSLDYNLIRNPSGATFTGTTTHNLVGVDPLLGPLANNGGASPTHALLVGSPAIDAGNSTGPADQRGQPRPVDDRTVVNAAGGNASDIGAYEAHNLEVNSTAEADDTICSHPGEGNGCTLREAINTANAQPGAEVITFSPALTAGGPATISLLIPLQTLASDMAILGPGAGLLTVERSHVGGTADFRIFKTVSGYAVILSGLTVANGAATGAFPENLGGNILNDQGTVQINNCVIKDTVAGGGVGNFGGSMTINDSTLSGNAGNAVTNAVPSSSSATTPAPLTINNSTITGNSGGGVNNSVVIGNVTSPATVTINNSAIFGNNINSPGGSAGVRNGVGAGGTGIVTINNSTISGNTNADGSGAVYNAAVFIGGSTLSIARVAINNSTIAGNIGGTGAGATGGIENVLSACSGCEASVKLRNTILAGNFRNGATPSDYSGVDADSASSFNLIGIGGSGGLSNSINHNQVGVADAKLGPLANNGGPTLTRALLPDSPAVDAGDNCVLDNSCTPPLASALTTDQRGAGFNRGVDGNGDGSANVDIGAYEVQGILVTTAADNGAGSLRQAIADANAHAAPDAIFFQPGLTGTITLDTALPDISSNLSITGPGANLLTVRRNPAGGTPDFRIFKINGGLTVTISGLTITGGNPTGAPPANSGGGIWNDHSALTIKDCIITGNTGNPVAFGGGVYNDGSSGGSSSLTVINSTISANNVAGNGGGIFNNAFNGSIGLTIIGSTISGNSADDGGGIHTIGEGGSATVRIFNSTLSGNNARIGGGISTEGTQVGDAPFTIVNSTISGNGATESGGGIVNQGTSLTVATVTITNSTITNNRSDTNNTGSSGVNGGGMFIISGAVTLRNSIVAGNFHGSAGSTADDINGNINVNSSFNLIGTGGSGGLTNGNNNNQVGVSDPGLAALANNGGPTQTHALLAGSPALDSAGNANVPVDTFDLDGDGNTTEAIGMDQRGVNFTRIVDGPDADTTATVDIGAFEAQVSIGNITDQTINEDASLSLPFNVGGAASITSVTASSSNTTLLPNNPANISISGSGSTRTLTINPVANLFGTSTITVTVNGNNGQTMTDTFLLTVNSVNDAPSFTTGPNQTVNENAAAQTVNNWASAILAGPANEAGQAVNFSISGNSNPGLFAVAPAVSSAGTLTYTPAAGVSGSATITLVLVDNGGTLNGGQNTSATQSFNITVSEGGALEFSSLSYSIAEDGVNALITVKRTGGSAGEARVNYTTANTTAVAGQDYAAASGTLTFANGVTSQSFNVGITNDVLDEPDEILNLSLNSPAGTGSLGALRSAVLTITDDDPLPSLSINDVAVTEGNSGTINATFTVTLSGQTAQTVTAHFETADGTAVTIIAPPGMTPPGSDYFRNVGTLTFAPTETTKSIGVAVIGDFAFEPNETFFVNLSAPTNATISDAQGTGTINNDDAPGGTLSFDSPVFTTTELAGRTTIIVERKGDTSQPATVDYATSDVTADGRKDYTPVSGTLHFDAGIPARAIQVLVNIDAFAEGTELVQVTLSNPTGGAQLGALATCTLQIDNSFWNSPPANSIDNAESFVRQHYHDFLNRDAFDDPDGLAFWTNQITECQQPGATCNAELRRINVSAAFYLSIEFQETGYLVYRMYKAGYGNINNAPVPLTFAEFLPDTQQIGEGVVVGRPGSEQRLESNKVAYAQKFVSRARFLTAHPTAMAPADFVDALYANAGVTPSPDERLSVIGEFGAAANTADIAARARALRRVAENSSLKQQELNKAFVLMQYFGYLRRNPYDPPEANLDFGGYNFWLGKLNEFNGNFVNAEMVKAFLVSGEYRQRFGP